MTWLFSKAMMEDYGSLPSLQAPVEEYSEASCSDGEPFAQLNVMPTQHKFWRNDKTMESSKLSQFGLTLRLLTESHGEALLTSYLAAFPVKTLASQAEVKGLPVNAADYGLNSNELLARLCPNMHMWKTAQFSLFADLEQSLETWPKWGLMLNGVCYQQENVAEFIYERAAGYSLPTPTVSEMYTGNLKSTQQKEGSRHSVTLPQALMMSLPTISANEFKGSGKDRFIGSPGFRGAKMSEGLRTCETDPIYLNPSFAELVMMWPLGWTDLKPLAMDKFLAWQQQHGNCSAKELDKAA